MATTNSEIPRTLTLCSSNLTSEEDTAGCNAPDANEDRITQPDICDSVFMHFSRILTIRELAQLKQVSKSVAHLVSINTDIATHARREGNTVDWYFPLLLQVDGPTPDDHDREHGVSIDSSTWSALHQPSGEVHRLPSLGHLLPDSTKLLDISLLASSGGLLLLSPTLSESTHLQESQNWRPLVVSNPVTKEWTLLPALDCQNLGLTQWDYEGSRAHMEVNERANAYKVILTFRAGLCVWNSTSNNKQWSFWNIDPIPWGFRRRDGLNIGLGHQMSPFVEAASAVVNGKLYYAELELDNDPQPRLPSGMLARGCVKVYEVDYEAGTWKPGVQYALRDYIPSDLHDTHINDTHVKYGFRRGSFAIGLVECMGSMYAIVPAALCTFFKVEDGMRQSLGLTSTKRTMTYLDYGVLPLRFYMLKLHGSVGQTFGQVVIRGESQSWWMEYQDRLVAIVGRKVEYDILINPHEKSSRWYQCVARGSVIWLTFGDYVIQYDIVSGRSTTEILPNMVSPRVLKRELAYEPSLHMKP